MNADEFIKKFRERQQKEHQRRVRNINRTAWLVKGAIIAAVIIPLIIGWVMR